MPDLNYDAPPTLARFMKSEAFGRIAAGPVGSGKTTSCVLELLRRSLMQSAAPVDGMRYTRFAVVRQTLKQFERYRPERLRKLAGGLRHVEGQRKYLPSPFQRRHIRMGLHSP